MSGASLSGPELGSGRAPRAVIFGCAGPILGQDEREFFRDCDPLGFILFQRNCIDPEQVRALTADLRAAVGRDTAPVLIDQEGGRVARLRPPHWRRYPAAAEIAALGHDSAEAARVGAALIALDLLDLGITVDCLPVLDLPVAGAHEVIGDRAYGTEPGPVAALARAACDGLLSGGVLPIVKHIPGHGRATVDSHLSCPIVTSARGELEATDFAPFHALRDMPWAMTAHVVYTAIDDARPATLSQTVIGDIIRGIIGFDGLLLSDDLSMEALGGALGARAERALAAGCDVVLHCNGKFDEMTDIAAASRPMDGKAIERFARGEALGRARRQSLDRARLSERFSRWFDEATASV